MFPIATTAGGMSEAFPDTCLTPAPPGPPVPTPYPNVAMCMQAMRPTCSLFVTIMNMPIVHTNSMIPMTSGDEAGATGGVTSGMIKGPAKPSKGSAKVKIEGQPAVFLTCTFAHNNNNAPNGILAAPSQAVVNVLL